ncbi:hypothetical protein Acsp06_17110 [Actinomycetospora sp. NBRC 106375]|uniref:hypothetical protein n=1 Tax=Actinomycetospora sp. NBRC 106375 TaxID=3032207 RepID=UPI0024A2FB1E|nr:hypothetical protein [Actinomycetospora sp. NBRC 106375]GLZ45526.1 hypothetical protein Acsp06_17110 [Actinomycetospora sp. NBRC 106375]
MSAPPRTKSSPRFTFDRDTAYRITVRGDAGERQELLLDAYQGWLQGPDGIRHRFGAHRRARTELRDDTIRTVVGP